MYLNQQHESGALELRAAFENVLKTRWIGQRDAVSRRTSVLVDGEAFEVLKAVGKRVVVADEKLEDVDGGRCDSLQHEMLQPRRRRAEMRHLMHMLTHLGD